MSFNLLNKKLRNTLKEKGFRKPTEAQKVAIPEIINGNNILLIAPTGIGKTESALLPVWSNWSEIKRKPISILYITPLKALNRDLLDRVKWWADQIDMTVSVRHGDTTQYERSKQSKNPPDMLITTPETVQSILTGSRMREHLKNIDYIVVDEIHELADSKRGVQLSIALERLKELSKDFQLVFLSATIGSPDEVSKFLAGGKDVKVVKAVTNKKIDLSVESPEPNKEDEKLAEKLYVSPQISARINRIRNLIESHRSSIVFTNTRDFAEILSSRLRQMKKEFEHDIHHSSLSKDVRIEAEKNFKEEKLKALISTSSLELGIDIGAIDIALQYMSPRQVSKLLQRVGRAGHNVNEISKGIIISGEPDDILESTALAKLSLEGKIEKLKIHRGAWDVLVNQIAAMAISNYDLSIDKAYEIIKRSYCYRNLEKEDFLKLIDEMRSLRLIYVDDKIKRKRLTREFYYKNLSMIYDTNQYKIINNLDNSYVGSLDEDFIAINGEPGKTFIVKGRPWKIVGTIEDEVKVEPVEDIEASVPGWEGELIPVTYETAQEVGKLRKFVFDSLDNKDIIKELMSNYPLSENAAKSLIDYIKNQSKFFLPDNNTVVFEKFQDTLIIHTCFGSLVNESLSRIITTMLSNYYGSVSVRTDPYRIIIQMPEIGEKVLDILKDIKPDEVEQLIRISIDRTDFFKLRFLKIAKKFGAIRPNADYNKINIKRIIRSFEGTFLYEEVMREILTEKMDIEKTKKVLNDIQSESTKVLFTTGPSPIGLSALRSEAGEIVTQKRPEKEIFEIFKDRLLDTEVRLLCINCANLSLIKKVREIEDEPVCKNCTSKLLASIRTHRTDLKELVEKYISGKHLNRKEQETLTQLNKNSDLIISHGKNAIIAQAGRGLGPHTTSRVLKKLRQTEKEFLKDILEEERKFARTKRYWS